MSFASAGAGIDHKKEEAFEKLLADRAKAGKTLAHETHHWGKEGEEDECFQLAELAAADQTSFIAAVKGAVAGGKNVEVKESAECHEGH